MNKSKTIIVATHIPNERGGRLFSMIKRKGFTPQIVELHAGEPIPHPNDYAALIVMGGLESVNNMNLSAGMQNGLAGIEQALKADKPFLGICLGMQMLVKVAGGKVIAAERRELGLRISYEVPNDKLHTLKITEEGKSDSLLKNLSGNISPIFQFHEATVDILEGMVYPVTVLAKDTDDIVPNQIIKIGKNAYGIQGHWEVTPKLLKLWFNTYSALWDFDADLIQQDFDKIKRRYNLTSKKIFHNWLDIISV
ncbi:MAG: type 1 glutamine amidotransferase [Candidatus Levyibacteriota bacterium]